MKILVNALPRTASKWFSVNLRRYLKKQCGLAQCLYADNYVMPITDWFNLKNGTLFFDGHIEKQRYGFVLTKQSVDIEQEFINRLKLLQNNTLPTQIKIHPDCWEQVIAIEALKPYVNVYYTLRRKNTFDHCLSICVCQETGVWDLNQRMRDAIDYYQKNPMTIDIENFTVEMNKLVLQNQYLDRQAATKHLFFEDLIDFNSSVDWCGYLGLPYVDFAFDRFFSVEYGENKRKMILNYNELVEISEKILTTQ